MELALGPRVAKSPFFDATVAAGVTHLSIYNQTYMPVLYGDPEAEYRRLTEGVSVWDVACQRQVELHGPDAAALAQMLCARDLRKQVIGQGKYAPVCDHQGRILNDPVVLKVEEDRWWLSIADGDVLWWARAIAAERRLDVSVSEPDVSPLAIQGPMAEDVVATMFGDWIRDLKYFWFGEAEIDGIPVLVSRSGWSKQGGYELYLRDGSRGVELWNLVLDAGAPYGIGPGAPNYVERIESNLLSFRADTVDECTPLELGLGRFMSLDSDVDFIGKDALVALRDSGTLPRRLVGVWLDEQPTGPNAHPWPASVDGVAVGSVRAVCHSYKFDRPIGLALIDTPFDAAGTVLDVDSETGPRTARVSELPFTA
ncbi:MAG: glycine cleavage T C-terminal barrel domain-containing protein [Actinomycetota bacterium]